MMKGQLSLNQTLWLGPDKLGGFMQVIIKGIQLNRCDMKEAIKGQSVTLAIKNANKKDPVLKSSKFRKGMSLIGLNKAH